MRRLFEKFAWMLPIAVVGLSLWAATSPASFPDAEVGGGSIDGDLDGNPLINSDGDEVVDIGGACTSNHSLNAMDACFADRAEFNGAVFMDSSVTFALDTQHDGNQCYAVNQKGLQLGTSCNSVVIAADDTADEIVFNLGTSADRQIVVATNGISKNYDHALDSDARLYMQGNQNPDSNNKRWMSIMYVAASDRAEIATGRGPFAFVRDGDSAHSDGRGDSTIIDGEAETLEFASNPGDASLTTTGLIPAGVILHGITTRVTTAGTNCTSIDIGDGTDVDLFAAGASVSVDNTTDNTDATASFSTASFGFHPTLTAGEVTVTANGGNCFDLAIDVFAKYITVGASTVSAGPVD